MNSEAPPILIQILVFTSKLDVALNLLEGEEAWLKSDYERVVAHNSRSTESYAQLARHATEAALAHARACEIFTALQALLDTVKPGEFEVPPHVFTSLEKAVSTYQVRTR